MFCVLKKQKYHIQLKILFILKTNIYFIYYSVHLFIYLLFIHLFINFLTRQSPHFEKNWATDRKVVYGHAPVLRTSVLHCPSYDSFSCFG